MHRSAHYGAQLRFALQRPNPRVCHSKRFWSMPSQRRGSFSLIGSRKSGSGSANSAAIMPNRYLFRLMGTSRTIGAAPRAMTASSPRRVASISWDNRAFAARTLNRTELHPHSQLRLAHKPSDWAEITQIRCRNPLPNSGDNVIENPVRRDDRNLIDERCRRQQAIEWIPVDPGESPGSRAYIRIEIDSLDALRRGKRNKVRSERRHSGPFSETDLLIDFIKRCGTHVPCLGCIDHLAGTGTQTSALEESQRPNIRIKKNHLQGVLPSRVPADPTPRRSSARNPERVPLPGRPGCRSETA